MNYPFSAVTGQSDFKLALILAAINPSIGGVLVSGPRGSAKSTLARALADLLSDEGDFITLPLGASEEMLIGTLDLQQVLSDQQLQFSPGLLAKAHHGVLYVDEVNLLPDALVDVLLDVAASKVNIIERDGISHQHDADFLLIGTMNPDEGELRPQLQDRFGLCVELSNQYSVTERMEIVQLREAFDRDPQAFCQQYQAEQQSLADQISASQSRLHSVSCSDELRLMIAERCQQAAVEGMRADLVWYRAALAHAAYQGRADITADDINTVEALVLAHRRQSPPPEQPRQPPQSPPPFSRPPESRTDSSSTPENGQGDWGSMPPQQQSSIQVGELAVMPQRRSHYRSGLGAPNSNPKCVIAPSLAKGHSAGGGRKGRVLSTRINWSATLAHNYLNKQTPNSHQTSLIKHWQWRYHPDKTGQSVLHLILLDTSASVLTQHAFAKAKGVIMNIAREAYLLRERLSILGFGNQQVQTLLPPVRAPKKIQHLLDNLAAGGGTPFVQVLQQTEQWVRRLKRQQTDLHISIYILTDGRIASLPDAMKLADDCVLIDTEQSSVKRGRGRELAQRLQARYVTLKDGV